MSIDSSEIKTVLALPIEDRYEFFLDQVIETGEIWGLSGDQWAMFFDDAQGYQLFPIWSDRDFAEANATGEWSSYAPQLFTVEQFSQDLVPQLKQANIFLSVFKSVDDTGTIAEPDALKALLEGKRSNAEQSQ